MARAFLFVLDSFGIGGAPDAALFNDENSNTLGHIALACQKGEANVEGGRSGPLAMPNMEQLGLGLAAKSACGEWPAGFSTNPELKGIWCNAAEVSKGKDTPSGHWEIAGVPVSFDWGYFPREIPCFPKELTDRLIESCNLTGIIGNRHASGTQIIVELGEEHISTGKLICYTSADSVLQIAAHETHFGLERLLNVCQTARELVDPYNIGRVIARPFIGENAENFERTGNRRDYSVPPPQPTLLDRLKSNGRQVIAIGKISDIYAHQGTTDVRKANGNAALFDATLNAMDDAHEGDLVFTNFVDFDMLYGHRRDIAGYATALEYFDKRLPQLINKLKTGDLMILTADHGCDPSWPGTDHTREQVPVLAFGPDLSPGSGGSLATFADIGETIAKHLDIAAGPHGAPFI
ncbi:MAG: phosphopentomutase [Rhizobiaceae bacterium]|nr:phosphopentomutase [Rhizobiaceae bacterium]